MATIRALGHGRDHMAFFTVRGSRNHHDLALMAVGPDAPAGHPGAVGLAHVAFKVGDRLDELRGMRDRFERRGVPIIGTSDHRVSQSLYFADPAIWREDPTTVATIRSLRL